MSVPYLFWDLNKDPNLQKYPHRGAVALNDQELELHRLSSTLRFSGAAKSSASTNSLCLPRPAGSTTTLWQRRCPESVSSAGRRNLLGLPATAPGLRIPHRQRRHSIVVKGRSSSVALHDAASRMATCVHLQTSRLSVTQAIFNSAVGSTVALVGDHPSQSGQQAFAVIMLVVAITAMAQQSALISTSCQLRP
eukprot:s2640_g12.t1